jgi:regulatory protein
MARPFITLEARALRHLAAREHSRVELARKLAPHAQDADAVEQLLDSLEAAKLLSQSRFCESLLHRRVQRFGNNRILAELQGHGIAGQELDTVKAALVDGEAARACAVWQRKFGAAATATDAAECARQMRFLQQRGFSRQAIRAAMQSSPADDDDMPQDAE